MAQVGHTMGLRGPAQQGRPAMSTGLTPDRVADRPIELPAMTGHGCSVLNVLNALASVAAVVGVMIQFAQLRRERTARTTSAAAMGGAPPAQGTGTPPARGMEPVRPAPGYAPTRASRASAPSLWSSPLNRTPATGTGLIVCILLGALGLLGLVGAADVEGAPPLGIVIAGGVLGLITVVAAILAWRGSRGGLLVVILSRVIDLPLGIPVYFTPDAPNWARVVVTIATAATLACIGLLSFALRRP
jgi:hypothetical protein